MDPTTPPAGSDTPQASVTHNQPGDTSNASTMKTGTLTDINGRQSVTSEWRSGIILQLKRVGISHSQT